MKFNTRNPVGTDGSTDPRDMYDNAGNLDKFSLSEADYYPDRLGKPRKTLNWYERDAEATIKQIEIDGVAAIDALIMVSAGDFYTGTVVTARNQTVLWSTENGGNGHEYRWAGALNKTVPAESTPSTTGGIYPDGLWIDVGVTQLRRDIAPVAGIKHLRKLPNIRQTALSFHDGLGVGGGDYIWLPNADQSQHRKPGPNGGILWSAAALDLYDGTPATLQALLNWVGVGYGCFELIGLKQLTPQNFGAGPIFDSYRPLQAAADFASANRMKLDIEIELVSSQKIYIASNTEIEIKTGGSISAHDDFEGQHLIQVGALLQLAENVRLYGSGLVDAKNKCDIAIDVHFSRFSAIGVKQVIGGNLRGIRIGHPDALGASYEVNISDDTTFWLGDVANDSNSIGVYHEKATDCYVTKTFSRGYRRSFANSPVSASIEYQMCHGWNRPENGPLVVVFDADGSQSTYVQCYADTPTNYGDSSITQVYGWRLNGFSPQLIACRIFINQSLKPNIAVTDLVKAVHFERELYGNIFGFKSAGGFPDMRYASLVSGPTETSTVMGLVDDGPSCVVDVETRKENYTNQKVFEFINGLKINAFAALSGPAGEALPFSLQRNGVDRVQIRLSGNPEEGDNTGSDFQINIYDDNGNYLSTMLQINRRFKKLQALEGLQIAKQLEFSNNYSVSTLPNGQPRGLIYVENGDSGAPCFAAYVGGQWRRIAIGTAVSSS